MKRARFAAAYGALFAVTMVAGPGAHAADLYTNNTWAAMASDRPATKVGDSLTIIVDESSTASNSASSGSKKSSQFAGQVGASPALNLSGGLSLSDSFDGSGQTQRVHKMIAQISVVVDAVLPNGDLHVVGAQALNINGERTKIRISGRVRPADIGSDNSVVSTRLADANIDYDGAGFVAASTKAGLITRLFNWLKLP
jgi:flagellar L-ring protein FlgH